MTQLAEETSSHMHNFSRFEQESSLPAHPWLERLRKSAIARFESTGFPTTSEEEWRHTNVAPIAKIPFRLARLCTLTRSVFRRRRAITSAT